MSTTFAESTITPIEINLQGRNDCRVKLTGDFNGGAILTVGNYTAHIRAQDLLNAARLLGAKDIEIKTK